jgi:hypothetical protein
VQLDPYNAIILAGHLVCAAKELPLHLDLDAPLFGGHQILQQAAAKLQSLSLLGRHPRDPPGLPALHYTGPTASPAADISLRTIDPERFIIYNTTDNRCVTSFCCCLHLCMPFGRGISACDLLQCYLVLWFMMRHSLLQVFHS